MAQHDRGDKHMGDAVAMNGVCGSPYPSGIQNERARARARAGVEAAKSRMLDATQVKA